MHSSIRQLLVKSDFSASALSPPFSPRFFPAKLPKSSWGMVNSLTKSKRRASEMGREGLNKSPSENYNILRLFCVD